MGLIGGIIGLLMTPVNFILGVLIAVVTLGTIGQLFILAGVGTIMSVTGMAGAVISGGRPRTGGVIMMASGLVPLLAGTALMISINSLGVIGILYAFYFWTFILVLSGIIAVLRGNKKQQPSPSHALAPSPPIAL
ncbi:MAG TPA: hypothetical protein VIH34_05005 [Candidatus Bathyarchaeia archaeon]